MIGETNCIIKKVWAVHKGRQIQETNLEQAIIFPSGICRVGVDAWRDLDKMDSSSHKVHFYRNVDQLKEEYVLVNSKKQII